MMLSILQISPNYLTILTLKAFSKLRHELKKENTFHITICTVVHLIYLILKKGIVECHMCNCKRIHQTLIFNLIFILNT